MTNDTASPANRQSIARLYEQIPKDWEPDSAYRLNHEIAYHDTKRGMVGIEDTRLDGLKERAHVYRFWPYVLGGLFFLASEADDNGLVLNPMLALTKVRGFNAKRIRATLYLLEAESAIYRTDTK